MDLAVNNYLLGGFIKSTLFLNLFLIALQIFDHKILSSQLKMISVVINALMWC